jgi:hypothetical protein
MKKRASMAIVLRLALAALTAGMSRFKPVWRGRQPDGSFLVWCIFVVEDDAQSGPDHVDGHRTVFMAISPYNARKTVDSSFYNQTNMIRSIEMMLDLDPMNKFDSVADPIIACFRDELDPTPYHAVPNNVPLDERNPSGAAMNEADRFWLDKSQSLDWSHLDAPDPYWLNRNIWHSPFKGERAYPGRPAEQPGTTRVDDDDDLQPGH